MQLLPMASSPDGLISARYAVITKTPGWEVLTTGGGEPSRCISEWTHECQGLHWIARPVQSHTTCSPFPVVEATP